MPCSGCGAPITVERSRYCPRCLLRAADADAEPPAGSTADASAPCELLALIAETPRASVFLGEQTWPVRRLVAFKVFSGAAFRPDANPERYRPAPWHRAIAPVVERGRINGRPYIVMPYLAGGWLVRRTDHLKLDATERLAALLAAAEGVAFAHAHGVAHGRLTPSNVLCEPHRPPAVQVVDFACNARKVAGDEPFDVLARADLDGLADLADIILRPLAGAIDGLDDVLHRLRISSHSVAEFAAGLRVLLAGGSWR